MPNMDLFWPLSPALALSLSLSRDVARLHVEGRSNPFMELCVWLSRCNRSWANELFYVWVTNVLVWHTCIKRLERFVDKS